MYIFYNRIISKNQNMNKQKTWLIQGTQWLCAIIQWLYWLMSALLIVFFFISIFSFSTIASWTETYTTLSINGLSIENMETASVFRLVLLSGILTFPLMAMVFRNAMLIIRTVQGKTWFSKGDTPFQNNVVRMIREMGIFLISIPFIELLISIVIELVHSVPEMSVSCTPIPIGLLLIVLSIYFQDGVNLQNDVDGLI